MIARLQLGTWLPDQNEWFFVMQDVIARMCPQTYKTFMHSKAFTYHNISQTTEGCNPIRLIFHIVELRLDAMLLIRFLHALYDDPDWYQTCATDCSLLGPVCEQTKAFQSKTKS